MPTAATKIREGYFTKRVPELQIRKYESLAVSCGKTIFVTFETV
jgi:hypothetical protein